jgi:hypothetical protein
MSSIFASPVCRDRHQQALDTPPGRCRIFKLVEQRLRARAQEPKHVARRLRRRLDVRPFLAVDEQRVPVAFENQRHLEYAIVFRVVCGRAVCEVDGLDDIRSAEPSRPRHHPREGRFGDLRRIVGIFARVDHPERSAFAGNHEAVARRPAVEFDDQPGVTIDLRHRFGQIFAGAGDKAHDRKLFHVVGFAEVKRGAGSLQSSLPARIRRRYFASGTRLS